MEIREATLQDRPAIRDIARRSLQASYSLGPKAITGAISEWYDEGRLQELSEDESCLLLVGNVDGQVVGFSHSTLTDETAEILWLHIDPAYRTEAYGEDLFEETRKRLSTEGAETFQGRVLADNPDGNAFYEHQGLSKVGEEEIEIDGESYTENVYVDLEEGGIEEIDVDGETCYLHHETTEKGSLAPFHVIYTDEQGQQLYGYWCSKCEDVANAMNAMGQIQCDSCGNKRKATRWDAAYL